MLQTKVGINAPAYGPVTSNFHIPDAVESCRHHLLEDVQPQVWHWKTESMEFSSTIVHSSAHANTVQTLGENSLNEHTVVMQKHRVVVPRHHVRETVRLSRRIGSYKSKNREKQEP